jgi:non-heme chloroperoxidase
MPTVTTNDGTEIFYKDWGKGQPLFFHHGWPLSADDWDAQMMFFLDHGYCVIAHDRRGHGRSTQTAEGHDIDIYADDAAELVKKLDLKNSIHIGHSTGGVRWRVMWGGMARARSPKRSSSARFLRPS